MFYFALISDHQWSDGSALDYTNWDKDEPNTHNNQELCAELGPNNKKWGYRNCGIVKNHICQIKRGKYSRGRVKVLFIKILSHIIQLNIHLNMCSLYCSFL